MVNAQWSCYAGCRSLHSASEYSLLATLSEKVVTREDFSRKGFSLELLYDEVSSVRRFSLRTLSEVASVRGFPSLASSCEVFLK